ncbi:helix-turn-helix transcriptional regulator [Carboxylicivirga mesophila]|uniref:Helix-turn-helix transcriptional regulator n=1 Tax=Carboxylicivirga mesophila TaxID=1166478 RepID=A0ABS5KBM5_9BACT|nr:helix-turn-helix transcriptional regulator [Carboxylicivirga mesophila]MBS2212227.1 helix-turn-helix transcriptional regulator [Carboxylicivirga mesophila]
MEQTGISESDQLILKRIGALIRQKRKAVSNNYENFAEMHKINKVTLSKIERGENFKFSTFLQILSALDIGLDDFFTELAALEL